MKTRTFLLALMLVVFSARAEDQLPPDGSEMAKAKLSTAPLGNLKSGDSMKSPGYRMESVEISDWEAADLPKGTSFGLRFKSMSLPGGGKGDYTISKKLPPDFKMLGGWFYVSPDTTLKQIGFQIQEAGGEYFLMTFPADFTGWKWLEGTREEIKPMIPTEKSGHDGIFDQPTTRVSVVWFSKDANLAEVGVAGLTVAGE